MQPADFMCDFCRRAWDGAASMVEGHQGSLICGTCLSVAYRALVLEQGETVEPTPDHGPRCTMCLEHREQSFWRSPMHDEALACERCVRQAAQALEKDPDSGWRKPKA